MSKIIRILASIGVTLGLALGAVAVTSAPAEAKTKYSKTRATKAEYNLIKKGYNLKQVRKIIGSNGKQTYYSSYTYSDYVCNADYSSCKYVKKTTRLHTFEWKNTSKYGMATVYFTDGKVRMKSWIAIF
jgi:hypothetical protein